MSDADRPRLAAAGCVYVTHSAAQTYAAFARVEPERARRELTRLLLTASLRDPGPPALYRYRSRSTGLDISARVTIDDGLVVVVAAEIRGYR